MAKAKLIVIAVENKPGTVAAAIASLSAAGINILSIFGWTQATQGNLQLVVDNPRKAMKTLAAAAVAHSEAKAEVVELPNKPGSLHAYLQKLSKKGINLRSICATSSKSARKSVIVWTADN